MNYLSLVTVTLIIQYVICDSPEYGRVQDPSSKNTPISGNFSANVFKGQQLIAPLNDWQPRPNNQPNGYPTGIDVQARDQAKDAAEEEQDAQESDDDHTGADEDNSDSKSSESTESGNEDEQTEGAEGEQNGNEGEQNGNEGEQNGNKEEQSGKNGVSSGGTNRVPEIGPLPDPVAAQLSAMFGTPVQRAALLRAVPIAQPYYACGVACDKKTNSPQANTSTNFAAQLQRPLGNEAQYEMQHQNIRKAIVPFYQPIGAGFGKLVKAARSEKYSRPLSENIPAKLDQIPATKMQGLNKLHKQQVPEIHINFSVVKPLGANQMLGAPMQNFYPNPAQQPLNMYPQAQPLPFSGLFAKEQLSNIPFNFPKEQRFLPNMNGNFVKQLPVNPALAPKEEVPNIAKLVDSEGDMTVRDSDDKDPPVNNTPLDTSENRTDPLNSLHFDAVPARYKRSSGRGIVLPKSRSVLAEISTSMETKPGKSGNIISPRERLKPKVTTHSKRLRVGTSSRGASGDKKGAPVMKYFRVQGKYSLPG